MRFDLVRPCAQCPFRTDIPAYLTAARVREIAHGLIQQQGTFSCHKTTVSVDDGEGGVEMIDGPKVQHCAGATIMLEKLGRPNQMMRIAERLGAYDPSKLDMSAPVFDTPAQMASAQPGRSRKACSHA